MPKNDKVANRLKLLLHNATSNELTSVAVLDDTNPTHHPSSAGQHSNEAIDGVYNTDQYCKRKQDDTLILPVPTVFFIDGITIRKSSAQKPN